jgi:DNA transposition AAA+ family ATPase
MDQTFIPTVNYQKCVRVKDEQLNPDTIPGISIFLGRSGRGKSTACKRIATLDPRVVLVSYAGWLSHTGLIRELAFAVGGARPKSAHSCFELLERGLAESRRILFIDESDRMSLKCLNVLRDIHDRTAVPLVLIGEEVLHGRLCLERRLISRICHEIIFEEVAVPDVAMFYQRALDLQVSTKMASCLARHAQGDFRMVVRDAQRIERVMRTSSLTSITDDLVEEVCR